nr:MAG TPA: hypothetical protein [Caudoviricetes sp.]
MILLHFLRFNTKKHSTLCTFLCKFTPYIIH